jgi:DNA-binding HxlR family transcriptional regulator
MKKKLANSFNCPTEFTLEVLGGKWKTVILCYLKQRPCRYAELRKLIPTLSDKVLTERLRNLLDAGLIKRARLDGDSRSEHYVLTPKGESLRLVLGHLYQWGCKHADSFGVKVGQPLERLNR